MPDARPPPSDSRPPPSVRSGRRLSDKILVAFHHACDEGALDVAEHLLGVAEHVVAQLSGGATPERRRSRETLVAAHERLWFLKQRQ